MKQSTIKQQKAAVKWFMDENTVKQRIALSNRYFPQFEEDNIDLEDEEIAHIYLQEHPDLPTEKNTGDKSIEGFTLDENNIGEVCLWNNERKIATIDSPEFSDLIVKAVNNHDALVSALRDAMEDLKSIACNYAGYSTNENRPDYIGKLASYAKAKELLSRI